MPQRAERQAVLVRDLLAFWPAHVQVADHQQRSVLDRQHHGGPRRFLLPGAVQALVAKRAGGAALNRVGDRVGVGAVEINPRPGLHVEHGR
jgi:hypothetical protein